MLGKAARENPQLPESENLTARPAARLTRPDDAVEIKVEAGNQEARKSFRELNPGFLAPPIVQTDAGLRRDAEIIRSSPDNHG